MKEYFIPLFALVLLIALLGGVAFSQTQKTPPVTGLWNVTGKDDEGIRWVAYLRLKRNNFGRLPATYSGWFDWRSADGRISGREFFNGSYSEKNGKLSFKAYKARYQRGQIGVGNYSSRVSRGGRFLKGRWFGENVVPGIWQARWIKY